MENGNWRVNYLILSLSRNEAAPPSPVPSGYHGLIDSEWAANAFACTIFVLGLAASIAGEMWIDIGVGIIAWLICTMLICFALCLLAFIFSPLLAILLVIVEAWQECNQQRDFECRSNKHG